LSADLGTACWDGTYECDEADCPSACADTECTLDMVDSFGDGWNGNVWSSGDQSATLESGAAGSVTLCFDLAAGNTYTCDGGSWQAEVSWTLTCGDDVITGGAPASGCFGNCDTVVYGCTDADACNYNPDATDEDGSCYGPDCDGVCDSGAVVDECGECGGDGSSCADCLDAGGILNWIADGYCDGSNNNEGCGYDGGDCCPGDCVDATYSCETFGGDCTTCSDPDSADNQEGGECFDTVTGCTDPAADNYNPDANTDDGSCIYDGCAAGLAPGCSEQDIADSECASSTWIGDGLCDGASEAWGINFCCYDLDGGDCTEEECEDIEPPAPWDAQITGFTAVGADYYGDAAVQWNWDALTDGTSCEENGQVSCPDGSCADSEDLCPEDPWADWNEQWAACTGNISWIGDGYCDSGNNNDSCGWDLGDCCPTSCAEYSEAGCPSNPAGCYSTISCGTCATCEDADNADNQVGGACYDYEEWTNAQCAASLVVTGSTDLDGDGYDDDCYTDGSAYYYFSWEGGCTLSGMLDWETGEYEDLEYLGFNSGFYYYGFELGSEIDFVLFFGDDVISSGAVAAACTDEITSSPKNRTKSISEPSSKP
jgi:hypothetical protein